MANHRSQLAGSTFILWALLYLSNLCDCAHSVESTTITPYTKYLFEYDNVLPTHTLDLREEYRRFMKTVKVHHMDNEPVILPAATKHSSSVIFLHGLNRTGQDLVDILLKTRQPFMKVILPTANKMCVAVNYNKTVTSWYPTSIHFNGVEDFKGILNATGYIHKLIDDEVKSGIAADRIIIGGFAQGGPLAILAALTYPKRLAGIVTWSTWLPENLYYPRITHPANRGIPVMGLEGKPDRISSNGDSHDYASPRNSISEKGLHDITTFLHKHVSAI